mmetsp:Transcript_118159/g.320692  ORF Transcript_118159/g.320692 Transcript_118159/m.320692 type:complete len:201 (-) Transcript_118159:632-1234(-)
MNHEARAAGVRSHGDAQLRRDLHGEHPRRGRGGGLRRLAATGARAVAKECLHGLLRGPKARDGRPLTDLETFRDHPLLSLRSHGDVIPRDAGVWLVLLLAPERRLPRFEQRPRRLHDPRADLFMEPRGVALGIPLRVPVALERRQHRLRRLFLVHYFLEELFLLADSQPTPSAAMQAGEFSRPRIHRLRSLEGFPGALGP